MFCWFEEHTFVGAYISESALAILAPSLKCCVLQGSFDKMTDDDAVEGLVQEQDEGPAKEAA